MASSLPPGKAWRQASGVHSQQPVPLLSQPKASHLEAGIVLSLSPPLTPARRQILTLQEFAKLWSSTRITRKLCWAALQSARKNKQTASWQTLISREFPRMLLSASNAAARFTTVSDSLPSHPEELQMSGAGLGEGGAGARGGGESALCTAVFQSQPQERWHRDPPRQGSNAKESSRNLASFLFSWNIH